MFHQLAAPSTIRQTQKSCYGEKIELLAIDGRSFVKPAIFFLILDLKTAQLIIMMIMRRSCRRLLQCSIGIMPSNAYPTVTKPGGSMDDCDASPASESESRFGWKTVPAIGIGASHKIEQTDLLMPVRMFLGIYTAIDDCNMALL
jgi:hypothetical protein